MFPICYFEWRTLFVTQLKCYISTQCKWFIHRRILREKNHLTRKQFCRLASLYLTTSRQRWNQLALEWPSRWGSMLLGELGDGRKSIYHKRRNYCCNGWLSASSLLLKRLFSYRLFVVFVSTSGRIINILIVMFEMKRWLLLGLEFHNRTF